MYNINCSQGKVIFCNPDTPLLNQLSMNNSYLLIAEGRVPDNDLSCLEYTHDVYIVTIASQNDFNQVPVEFMTILEQIFDRKMFTLLKKVSRIILKLGSTVSIINSYGS